MCSSDIVFVTRATSFTVQSTSVPLSGSIPSMVQVLLAYLSSMSRRSPMANRFLACCSCGHCCRKDYRTKSHHRVRNRVTFQLFAFRFLIYGPTETAWLFPNFALEVAFVLGPCHLRLVDPCSAVAHGWFPLCMHHPSLMSRLRLVLCLSLRCSSLSNSANLHRYTYFLLQSLGHAGILGRTHLIGAGPRNGRPDRYGTVYVCLSWSKPLPWVRESSLAWRSLTTAQSYIIPKGTCKTFDGDGSDNFFVGLGRITHIERLELMKYWHSFHSYLPCPCEERLSNSKWRVKPGTPWLGKIMSACMVITRLSPSSFPSRYLRPDITCAHVRYLHSLPPSLTIAGYIPSTMR